MQVASRTLPAYASKFSKRDFTQPQLVAMLALKQFFKTDDRGLVALLQDLPELRAVLEIRKVPHFTTLFHAQRRLAKKKSSTNSWTLFLPTPNRCD